MYIYPEYQKTTNCKQTQQNEEMSASDTALVLLERLKISRQDRITQSRSTQDVTKSSIQNYSSTDSSHFCRSRRQKETQSDSHVVKVKSSMEKKRAKGHNNDVDSSIFIFNPPDWKWQKNKANELELPIDRILWNKQAPWHLFTVDTPPKRCQNVSGDGNCLFRAISFWITGSEDYHLNLRNAIVREFVRNAPTYKGLISCPSVEEYLRDTSMHQEGVWGTEVEIFVAASLLKTPVMVHAAYGERHLWQKFKPFKMQAPTADQLRRYQGEPLRSTFSPLPTESTTTIYLHNSSNHFEPVTDI